eukprot:TRINITY_DN21369_c0_g1_i2.p1 TRINITY_DN21369_c0_g1~~TRINITY_DN21369_c0_g1_i2.p1  ORF type:complete len:296 (+),score=86.68 TRINITY_DN21369_c0_g1_i2:85-888(+)
MAAAAGSVDADEVCFTLDLDNVRPSGAQGEAVEQIRLLERESGENLTRQDSMGSEVSTEVYTGPADAAGKRCGRGRLVFPDGVYDGEFRDNRFHGHGVLRLRRGSVYEGGFARGKFDGVGKMLYIDGRVYTGQMKDGCPDGYGILTHPEGWRYEGGFELGHRHGIAKIEYSAPHECAGASYYGGVYEGVLEGEGVWADEKGVRYKGRFSRGRRVGMFLVEHPDGRVFKQRYAQGRMEFERRIKPEPETPESRLRKYSVDPPATGRAS